MSRTCISLLLATLVAGFGGGDAAYHAVVDAAYDGAPGAFVDGAPTYARLGAALATVPEGNAEPFVIFIREGVGAGAVVDLSGRFVMRNGVLHDAEKFGR